MAAYILKDADAIVTFNGKKFDWKFLQTRLLKHGHKLMTKIVHIDLYQECRSNLFLYRNNLNTISQVVNGKEKMKHSGWDLWVDVHMLVIIVNCIQ